MIDTLPLKLTGVAINGALGTAVAHATTCDIWAAGGDEVLLTGSAVTFTDVPDAPQAGAVRYVIANAAHILTDGANIEVQGDTNYTCAVGDVMRWRAKTVSSFQVSIFTASGEPVVLPDTAVPQQTVEVFTSTGTWSKPTGCLSIVVHVIGGGGNGATATSSGFPLIHVVGAGGGAGGYSRKLIDVTAISSVTVTVGAAAGTSSFGAHCSAAGGVNAVTTTSGSGGVGSDGDINTRGGGGTISGGKGGDSVLAGGGRQSTGGAGQAGAVNSGGGGAGGGATNGAGGAGGTGLCWVEEFY